MGTLPTFREREEYRDNPHVFLEKPVRETRGDADSVTGAPAFVVDC